MPKQICSKHLANVIHRKLTSYQFSIGLFLFFFFLIKENRPFYLRRTGENSSNESEAICLGQYYSIKFFCYFQRKHSKAKQKKKQQEQHNIIAII